MMADLNKVCRFWPGPLLARGGRAGRWPRLPSAAHVPRHRRGWRGGFWPIASFRGNAPFRRCRGEADLEPVAGASNKRIRGSKPCGANDRARPGRKQTISCHYIGTSLDTCLLCSAALICRTAAFIRISSRAVPYSAVARVGSPECPAGSEWLGKIESRERSTPCG
jgi:hypothetical protein